MKFEYDSKNLKKEIKKKIHYNCHKEAFSNILQKEKLVTYFSNLISFERKILSYKWKVFLAKKEIKAEEMYTDNFSTADDKHISSVSWL